MLDRDWIAARIPHQGSMCLLDGVREWSPERIVCTASSHRDPENPLRAAGRLGVVNGIEYAAQAMAVHGALLAGQSERPGQGYLTSVRGVELFADRLDDVDADLELCAERLSGDGNNILYQFAVRAGAELLLQGRAAVILDSTARAGERS